MADRKSIQICFSFFVLDFSISSLTIVNQGQVWDEWGGVRTRKLDLRTTKSDLGGPDHDLGYLDLNLRLLRGNFLDPYSRVKTDGLSCWQGFGSGWYLCRFRRFRFRASASKIVILLVAIPPSKLEAINRFQFPASISDFLFSANSLRLAETKQFLPAKTFLCFLLPIDCQTR